MYFYKFAVLFLLAAITVVYTNCGSQGQLAWQSNQIMAGSQDAFEATVYPITRANCASCHETQSPQHASADVVVAHEAAFSKVNFGNIPASRLVKKLRDENHNCWSNCSENADEMQAAIEEWYESVKLTDEQSPTPTTPTSPTNPAAPVLKTASTRTIAEELADITNLAKSPTAEAKVLSATLTAPMVRAKDAVGDFFHVPTDGVVNELAVGAANAGLATFNVRLPAAGTYRIYANVVAPDANSNSVFAGIAPQTNPTAYIGGLRNSNEITVNANPTWSPLEV